MDDDKLKTRRSLITRLRNWEDHDVWREFFDTYWRLIYAAAIKAGCDDQEAEDVVQETVLTVAKKLDGYTYEPERCSFKTWLMHLTRWRIIDQVRKRRPDYRKGVKREDPSRDTPTIERLEDPAGFELKDFWEEEWQRNLLHAAMERVKREVRADHYQIFYLSSVKQIETAKVARLHRVNRALVHLIKHRVARAVREEVRKLEAELNRDPVKKLFKSLA